MPEYKHLKITKSKAYAFWDYDLYPFTHGGKVTEIRKYNDGTIVVYTEEYGNSSFHAKYWTDAETGEKLLKELGSLKESYDEAVAVVKRVWKNKLKKSLKTAGIKKKGL